MQNQLDQVATDLKKHREKQENEKPVSQFGSIYKALQDDKYKAMIVKGKGSYDYQFKVISNASMVAGDDLVNLPFREMGIDKSEVRPLLISQIIQWGTTASKTVDWIERTTKTDAAAARAEGASMAEGDLGYTEVSTAAKIVSELMKVTQEALKDTAFLASEINTELISDVMLELDDQLLSGDGTSNTLIGIETVAKAFAAGTLANTVYRANNFDVIRAASNQIFVAGKGKYVPNFVLMHPTDVTGMDMLKDPDTGMYILPPFKSADGTVIAGVRVIQNTGITLGDYLIGDFNRAKGYLRDPLEIKIWDQNSTDAEKNQATITGNMRVALRIRNQEKFAFVTGTFADDIDDLVKV